MHETATGKGMLTLERAAEAAASRRDRHRGRRLHRPLRPADGQALRRRASSSTRLRRTAPTAATTSSPPTWRWSRCRATTFANWELGYGDVHLVPDLATLRVAELARQERARALRRARRARRTSYVRVAPRSILREQVDAAGASWASRPWPPPSSSTTSSARLPGGRAGGLRSLEPAGWYLEDYHILQGARTEDFNAAVRRHLRARACRSRTRRASGASASTS